MVLKIEERAILFKFEARDCTFNVPGSYYLKLSIQCKAQQAQALLKKVTVWPDDDEDLSIVGLSTVTSTVDVTDTNKNRPQKFIDNCFTFHLPKGLCSPAKHDIVLLVQVFSYTENDSHDDNNPNIGQATFIVYPRTSAPFVKLQAQEGETLYRYRGTLNLRRSLNEDGLVVLGGRLTYSLSLKMADEEPEPEPLPESPPLEVPPEDADPRPVVPVEDSPPLLRPKTLSVPTKNPLRVAGQPRKERNPRRGSELLRQNHVSKPGKEELVMIIHAATDLPRLPDGSTPRAYVAGIVDDSSSEETQSFLCTTHAAHSASMNPTWEEAITITVPLEEESGDQTVHEVTLQVIHEPTRSPVIEYKLPVYQLQPFHQYHLDLVQDETHLFVSVLRRKPRLLRLDDSLLQSQDALGFHGLEVLLLGVEEPLANPIGPLIAVARLLPDLFTYRQQTAEHNLQAQNVVPLTVEYPDPHPSSFLLPQLGTKNSQPQVSLVGQPEEQPTWHHSFLFTQPRELASLFTDIAALALQFYPATNAFMGDSWALHTPSAYCAQLLDTRVYQALRSDRGRLGIRISLPLQGSGLKSREAKTPWVSIVIRLITSRKPDSLATASDLQTLPTLPTFLEHEVKSPEPTVVPISPSPTPSPPPRATPSPPMPASTPLPVPLYPPRQQKPRRYKVLSDDELPSHDAIQNLLPSHKGRHAPTRNSDNGLIPTRLPPSPDLYQFRDKKSKPNSAPTDGTDKYTLSLMDAQQKEINSYREALKRMGEEIVHMQEQIARLETDNSKLRQRINMYEDSAKAMVGADDLDEVTKAELLEKYMVIRQKLARQVSETTNYRDKLLQLQNDMIKQNDREQLYLNQQHSASDQGRALQEKQVKIKKLERTCREQEKALEKMEKLLMSKRPRNDKQEDARRQQVEQIASENSKLKAQIEQIRADSASKTSKNNEGEKLMLHLQLEKAKSRVQSLERELTEKAREWGKQKEGLRLRMGEQHHSYNQRALPPLHRDRGYNYSDEDMDLSYKALRQNSPNIPHRFY
ncbi:coiled-coil domain-containing protein 33-like isoform X1 [Asterias amurensis]|uniref:coiled-coil domain-containing protein 33-like isoform X1 n=1 Tax=Asterias amurensis TaxID=7602 RepID=UPI003AB7505F